MKLFHSSSNLITILLFSSLILLPLLVRGECNCTCKAEGDGETNNKHRALKFKFGAIASILVFGAIGVCLPLLSKIFPSWQAGSDFFFMIKAFAAGVILATGFIHVLPDAFEHLTSPCLKENPWANFPFTGFISMMGAIGTLMVDTLATSYYRKIHFSNEQPVTGVEDHASDVLASNGHFHGSDTLSSVELMRHRIVSQVLELGIVVHSVIIGISLGASENPSTVKTLLVALSFHQFFEGMGLGGCISQAKFKTRAVICMGFFFAITTPFGIAVGIIISSGYKENSPSALILEGCFNSASAGILIYMALVDLLAADFMSSKIQGSGKLQVQVYVSLLAGAGLMSLLAKWA